MWGGDNHQEMRVCEACDATRGEARRCDGCGWSGPVGRCNTLVGVQLIYKGFYCGYGRARSVARRLSIIMVGPLGRV